jgi:hypothetical protein
VVWAAVGKSLGFTPEGLINEVRRARYTDADFRRLASGRLATLSGERGLRERCRACGQFDRGP